MAVTSRGFTLSSKHLASGPRIDLECVACRIGVWYGAIRSGYLFVYDGTVDPAWVRLSPTPEVEL